MSGWIGGQEMQKTVYVDCKYWQHSCDMCGITGNDYCPRNCKDYEEDAYDLYDEEW